MNDKGWVLSLLAAIVSIVAVSGLGAKEIKLLNVSYDPTREFYQEFNAAFAKYWKEKTGDAVTVLQSHGGRGNRRGPSLTDCRRTW